MDALLGKIRACRICVDDPTGAPLPHTPRPVLRASRTARIGVFGQAPGTRVHASGIPFTDPSGVRLRQWMNVDEETFYDVTRIAIVPMGFCFPGLDKNGGDLPPRKECAPLWRKQVMAALVDLDVVLLVGAYAQRWHLGSRASKTLTETVQRWREFAGDDPSQSGVRTYPLPHPSWRNNAWLKKNSWFEAELLPHLQGNLKGLLSQPDV